MKKYINCDKCGHPLGYYESDCDLHYCTSCSFHEDIMKKIYGEKNENNIVLC